MNKFILLIPFLLLLGCIDMGTVLTVQNNDTVSVNYVGSLQNGQVFDTSLQSEAQKAGLPQRPSYEPLEFKVGAGQMIPGFDKAVVGMKKGEEKTVTINPEDAYGAIRQEMIISLPLDTIQGNITVGSILQHPSGAVGKVISLNETSADIDFNHELAGKTLVFKITVVDLKRS